ncbi:outer membrane beta-barrel protein [Pedobacter glucosidilyticus]|uniref:type IX secretion/gliding motility protein PorT/SprT n=1 Tax=Pedobacter glucosidilyticus TaxID=1122941 RepID=UPI000402B09C|nr:outer membrane beta-barrel protein [Pedobacter glucosidilyticus]
MIKSLSVLLLTIFFAIGAQAQGNWGGGVDDETLHFGFTFQYIQSEYKIQKGLNWRDNITEPADIASTPPITERLNSVSSSLNPGFGIGLLANLYVTKHLDLRFTPTLIFADRVIDYEFESGNKYEQETVESPEGFTRRAVSSTMIDFPLLIKLKSDRKGNFRAYLIGGLKYGYDIGAKKNADDADNTYFNKLLKNQQGILSYEAGLGFDLYFEFFKLSPEIKISNSINSVLRRGEDPYSTPLDKLFLRNFIFSLYFE